MNKKNSYDVIVLGGGITGLIQSILLAQNNIRVLCLDKKDEKKEKTSPFYQRTTAISYGSSQLLRVINLWDKIEKFACPIKTIDIKDGAPSSLLTLSDQQKQIFGWVVQNGILIDVLTKEIKKLKFASYATDCAVQNIDPHDDHIRITDNHNKTYSASLLIGADGRQSFVRQSFNIPTESFPYNQNAVVAVITHTNPHNNNAVEHFRKSGPFAVLPMMNDKKGRHRSSIVWTEEKNAKTSRIDMDDAMFLIALSEQLPSEYGDILKIESRFSYPLGFIHAHHYISTRTALIGDAAHGIHPIAGQGLNLGLRDVACLSERIIENQAIHQDIGSNSLLAQYQNARRADNTLMAFETDQINRLFSSTNAMTKILRKMGLRTMNRSAFLKQKLIDQMMGQSGNIPRFIKDGKI